MPDFLKLFWCRSLCAHVCVCVSTPKATNNHWYDMDPYDRLNKFFGIIDGHGVGMIMCHGN